MTGLNTVRSKTLPERITISVPSDTKQRREEAKFIFGSPDARPDSHERLNVAERFAWVGGCLTRFATLNYLEDLTEARRRLEEVNAGESEIKPFLRDPQKWKVFDLPPRSERRQPLEPADCPGLFPSFVAEAGHVIYNIGDQLQEFMELSGTVEASEPSDSDTNLQGYSVDRFTRSHSPVPGEAQRHAGKVALTLTTSQSSDLEQYYAAQVAFSGNRRDVQARFSYSENMAQSKDTPSRLSVSGNIVYGDDFRFQNIELASLVVAGMRMEHMGMNI